MMLMVVALDETCDKNVVVVAVVVAWLMTMPKKPKTSLKWVKCCVAATGQRLLCAQLEKIQHKQKTVEKTPCSRNK